MASTQLLFDFNGHSDATAVQGPELPESPEAPLEPVFAAPVSSGSREKVKARDILAAIRTLQRIEKQKEAPALSVVTLLAVVLAVGRLRRGQNYPYAGTFAVLAVVLAASVACALIIPGGAG